MIDLPGQVDIVLGGGGVGVTHQFRQHLQIEASIDGSGAKGMPNAVDLNLVGQMEGLANLANEATHGLTMPGSTIGSDEDVLGILLAITNGDQDLQSGFGENDHPRCPIAASPGCLVLHQDQGSSFEIQILPASRTKFTGPTAGVIEKEQTLLQMRRTTLKHSCKLLLGHRPTPIAKTSGHRAKRILLNQPLLHGPVERSLDALDDIGLGVGGLPAISPQGDVMGEMKR